VVFHTILYALAELPRTINATKNPRTSQKMRPTRFPMFNNRRSLIISYIALTVICLRCMEMGCSREKLEAQASVEFMFIFVFFMAVLVVIMAAVLQNTQGVYSSTLDLQAEGALSMVKSKLDTAFLEGSGFSTNFTLPDSLMSYDYSVNITSKFLTLEVANQTYSKTLLTNSTVGIPRKGENSVRNEDGRIVIS
jgi:hypothetical protein